MHSTPTTRPSRNGAMVSRDDLAVVVEDADVHGPGVQVHAAVESMLTGVEAHGNLRVGWGPEPASWWGAPDSLKIPRWDKAPP
jgi:hypothetical protein